MAIGDRVGYRCFRAFQIYVCVVSRELDEDGPGVVVDPVLASQFGQVAPDVLRGTSDL